MNVTQDLLVYAIEFGANFSKAFVDQTADFVNAVLVYGDLDTRFVFVVTATQTVPDRYDCLEVGQQVFFWEEVVDDFTNHRCPAKATTNNHFVAAHAVTC